MSAIAKIIRFQIAFTVKRIFRIEKAVENINSKLGGSRRFSKKVSPFSCHTVKSHLILFVEFIYDIHYVPLPPILRSISVNIVILYGALRLKPHLLIIFNENEFSS